MSLSDPIADMLTRIRNAGRVGQDRGQRQASKVCEGVAAGAEGGRLYHRL